eukprot:13851631-Ditylum_brightwellii.AAC.2
MAHLQIGSQVSGAHGELWVPPADPGCPNKRKHRVRRKLYGQIAYSTVKNTYRVIWDNGQHGDYNSRVLRYEGEGTPHMQGLA